MIRLERRPYCPILSNLLSGWRDLDRLQSTIRRPQSENSHSRLSNPFASTRAQQPLACFGQQWLDLRITAFLKRHVPDLDLGEIGLSNHGRELLIRAQNSTPRGAPRLPRSTARCLPRCAGCLPRLRHLSESCNAKTS